MKLPNLEVPDSGMTTEQFEYLKYMLVGQDSDATRFMKFILTASADDNEKILDVVNSMMPVPTPASTKTLCDLTIEEKARFLCYHATEAQKDGGDEFDTLWYGCIGYKQVCDESNANYAIRINTEFNDFVGIAGEDSVTYDGVLATINN